MSESADADRRGEEQEAAYREEVWAYLPRNYVGHVLHGLLGQTGFRLINAPTFIPSYLFALSGSDFVVGLARAMQYFGMFLSPIWAATLIEHRRRVLPMGFAIGAVMRVQILGIALAGFFLSGSARLAAVCLFLGLFGFFLGMQGVIFNYLMSKVIPVEKRGFLLGLRNFLAGGTAIGVAWLAGSRLVEADALGDGYAATFLLAFGLTAVGLCMLMLMREPRPPIVKSQESVLTRLRDLPGLLRSDVDFARYFVCRALGTMGRMAVPFYILYAGTRAQISGAQLGQLTALFLLAQTSANLAWGWLADRTGFRLVFILALLTWMAASGLLLVSAEFWALAAVLMGLGAGQGGFQLASQNIVLEFGAREDLPMRIAMVSSGTELVGAVGPLVGGAVAATWSYPAVFWISLVFQGLAVAGMAFFVEEPRSRTDG